MRDESSNLSRIVAVPSSATSIARRRAGLYLPKCKVPRCDGVSFDRSIQQKLWDKYFTAAPAQRRQYDAVSSVVRKASNR